MFNLHQVQTVGQDLTMADQVLTLWHTTLKSYREHWRSSLKWPWLASLLYWKRVVKAFYTISGESSCPVQWSSSVVQSSGPVQWLYTAASSQFQQPLHNCVHFSCRFPMASVSAAAPRLCIRYSCCSSIASPSVAAPRVHPLAIMPHSTKYNKYKGCVCVTSLVPPPKHTTSITHAHTHTTKILI